MYGELNAVDYRMRFFSMSPKEDGQEDELKRDGGPLGLLLERMIMVTTQISGAYPVTDYHIFR